MRLYGGNNGLDDDELYRMADSLLSSTNFMRSSGYGWRFSRDGIFPACPMSSEVETQSYEGFRGTNFHLSNGLPVMWEKGPYHGGKRHVLLYRGTEFLQHKLVPESEFRSLTNAVAGRAK